jgi:hypothetical protein
MKKGKRQPDKKHHGYFIEKKAQGIGVNKHALINY